VALTLISAQEVVGKGPTTLKLAPQLIDRDHISEALYRHVRPFLGPTLYSAIIADKKTFTPWDESASSYAINALIFSGVNFDYYKRINEAGNSNPESDSAKWQTVEPFANADYNNLWREGLWRLCAYLSIHNALPFIWGQISNAGVGTNKVDTFEAFKRADVDFLRAEIMQSAETCKAQIHDFICAAKAVDSSKYTGYANSCEGCENKELSGNKGVNQNFGIFLDFNK